MRTLFVCTFLFFCFLTDTFGQKYQTDFFDETSFERPINIPTSILRSLKKDINVEKCQRSNSKFSANWFEATKINLNDDRFADVLIKAKNKCISDMASAFWLFLRKNNKYELVLNDYTIVMKIKRQKTKGLYNIQTSRATAMDNYISEYVFDGKAYYQKRKYLIPNYNN